MSISDRDRALGMDRPIDRRDFLNGVAVATGASMVGEMLPGVMKSALAAEATSQDQAGYYPPTRTGLRGSHPGSFETAHALRDGTFKPPAEGRRNSWCSGQPCPRCW